MKKYNIVNNTLGWLCFVIAAATYLLTIEPTASFWDCPEFISQGAKLEVGHPPGNPIFMLTARFFVTIFGGDITQASVAVNSMSALLSAATILLLFWTITHLIRKIVVRDDAGEISLAQMIVIMGGGVCGALAYTWSDTFWFSAVEGEVYAFSSFCTALVFWLILKWENRADQPHSDRYLVLIAYVIGVSIAVHLLNLLCIPAIVLVFYYRKYKNTNAKGSLIALGISVVIVALILYGLVPGFIKVAQGFELFFVNVCGMSYNMGVLIYAIVLVGVFIATVRVLYTSADTILAKLMVFLTLALSGLTFISGSMLVWAVLLIGAFIAVMVINPMPRRIYSIAVLSIFVIFVGYSSYALLLIRATADTPMNQNAPDNVFSLSSYLNREQYGKNPLLYGQVFAEELDVQKAQDAEGNEVSYVRIDYNGRPSLRSADAVMRTTDGTPIDNGEYTYSKVVKGDPSQPDKYVKETRNIDYEYSPDVKMLFTRMYSGDPGHISGYKSWALMYNEDIENLQSRVPRQTLDQWKAQGYAPLIEIAPYLTNMTPVRNYQGVSQPTSYVWKPSMLDNLRYFLNYQLNHMYWRYFMWNFAGRQNDIQGNGEPHVGNWISGIPVIDNARLGDQSMLPKEFTTDNKGHNVFYMLPLLMGLIGLLWQSLFNHRNNPKRGIEQFWVVFFLFFMTGIAIVLYLNQPPGQPRERDYAFAGSFYAFAIWIGMGVPAIWALVETVLNPVKKGKAPAAPIAGKAQATVVAVPEQAQRGSLPVAVVAAVIGVLIPLQMVSQTWDDHDRSHRYTTRDFGENYLNSLDPNAIIFTNGDNDTFPLWYAQEVEGVRTDVRVVNLSYLSTDWYANQLLNPYYDADKVKMLAKPTDYAYDRLAYSYVIDEGGQVDALESLKRFYSEGLKEYNGQKLSILYTPDMVSHIDRDAMIKRFGINPESNDSVLKLPYLQNIPMTGLKGGGFGLNKLLSFDIVANSINNNFERPVYFATTVPESFYLNLMPNMQMTGLAYQVTPFYNPPVSPLVDKAYENIVSKFRWGGLDDPAHNGNLYLDETVRRMVSTVRSSMLETAADLYASGDEPASEFAVKWAADHNLPKPANRYDMARYMLNLMEEKLPDTASRYEGYSDMLLSTLYMKLYNATGNADDLARAEALINKSIARYAQFTKWGSSLNPSQLENLGSAEQLVRFHFPMFVAFKGMLDLAKTMKADPEKYKDSIEAYDTMIDSNLRAEIYPLVFFKGRTKDFFIQEAAKMQGRDAQDYLKGAAIMEMFEQAGIDPVKAATAELTGNGLTVAQLEMLNPYMR